MYAIRSYYAIPSGWTRGTDTGRGFCMRPGSTGTYSSTTQGNNVTLFITNHGTGSTVENIFIGSGLTCCGPDWLGMRILGDGNAQLSGTWQASVGTAFYSYNFV